MTTLDDLLNQKRIAELDISKQDALERLHKNQDFKLIILNGFLGEYVHQVLSKRAKGMEDKEFLGAMDSINGLRSYLEELSTKGELARTSLEEAEQAMTILYKETYDE